MPILNFIPTEVGPSKLDQVLAYCPELCDESKTKLCIIQDIIKVGKALGKNLPTPLEFYHMYDLSLSMLERIQHDVQVVLNTERYHNRLSPYDSNL